MRVLLFAVCVLFGSVSCLVGEDSSGSNKLGIEQRG